LRKKQIFLIILLLLFSGLCYADTIRVIDLGVRGFTTPINRSEILSDYNRRLTDFGGAENPRIQAPSVPQFLPVLEKAQRGELSVKRFKLSGETALSGKKIFVFSALDPVSLEVAQTVKPDYGICIEYRSLADIADFKKRAGINYMIQAGTEKTITFLKLKSYPAIVTAKEDIHAIPTGF